MRGSRVWQHQVHQSVLTEFSSDAGVRQLFDWSCYGLRDRPPILETHVNCVSLKTLSCLPVADAERYSIMREHVDSLSVSSLDGAIRPATIFGTVISVIIHPINAMLGRRFSTHVGEKISVRHPSFAHFYSPTAIISVADVFRILTPRYHAAPRDMLRRATESVGLTLAFWYDRVSHVLFPPEGHVVRACPVNQHRTGSPILQSSNCLFHPPLAATFRPAASGLLRGFLNEHQ